MTRLIVLELTHTHEGQGHQLWALRLRYRPRILGEVLAHGLEMGDLVDGPWDWSAAALKAAA